MTEVNEALDRLVPEPARTPAWEEVLQDARPPRRSLSLQLALATGIAALVALFFVAPWQGTERVGILDRALAAAGDGPVLHVVFRGDWGGTLVDLETGKRTPLYGEREVWYDPDRDRVHTVVRFGGAVERESQYRRKPADRELKALWQQYRTALENGTARVVGEDVVGDIPVYWVLVWRQMFPDVADGKRHEYAQQVAISRESFEPVAMRYTRDRETVPRGTERILRYETVSVAEADFTSTPDSREGQSMSMGSSKPIALEQASESLGRAPYWLGKRFAGLPLVQTEKAFYATRVNSSELRSPRSGPRLISSHVGVTFFYGTLGDDPSTFKKDLVPLWTEPRVVLTQTTDPELVTRGSTTKYEPPAGSLMLMPGPSGYLIRDGLRVTILSASEELILGAARSLRPMPSGGSGGGG